MTRATLERELRKSVRRFKSFSCDEQAEIVRRVFEGDPADLVGVLPTGKGKSLCFLLPTYLWKRDEGRALTVIVSPILALMQDQLDAVERLNAEYGDFNLRVAQLNSLVDVDERRRIRRELRNGEIDILYLGPETLVNPNTYEMLVDAATNRTLRALVIDEAHIIATWGNEFRTSFKRLGPIRQMLAEACPADQPLRTLLLSATLPDAARAEVLDSLGMPDDTTIVERAEIRTEHFLRVRYVNNHEEKLTHIADDVKRLQKTGSGIVYCATRADCHTVADLIERKGLGPAAVFHGNTPGPERRDTLNRFRRDGVRIIVATCAFGLGVDKPDVRWILHYAQPGSLDQYYQEIGRAGRDGKPCEAMLYYAPIDKALAKKHALSVLSTDKFDQRLRSMREGAIEVGHDVDRAPLRLFEEETIPSYVEDPEEVATRKVAVQAHAKWNYATLVRAHELGWLRLGPDVLHRVACVRAKRATATALAERAPTLASLKLLRQMSPTEPVVLELGRAAGTHRQHPRKLQREFLDLLLGGLVHLPDDPAQRLWDTRVLVAELASRAGRRSKRDPAGQPPRRARRTSPAGPSGDIRCLPRRRVQLPRSEVQDRAILREIGPQSKAGDPCPCKPAGYVVQARLAAKSQRVAVAAESFGARRSLRAPA
jgi:RecQ family ATP-dependent DNA helicase